MSSSRAHRAEMPDQATDLGIGVFEESRPCLLQAAHEPPFVRFQFLPRLHAGIRGCQAGSGRNDPELDLPLEVALAQNVPPVVESTAVLVDVRLGRLVRVVHGAGGEIHEERRVRVNGFEVADEPDGVVHQVLGEVVALFRGLRRVDRMVVVGQLRVELIGRARQEPVEPVETPVQGPFVVGTGGRVVFGGVEVPLAEGEGGKALLAQHFRQGGGVTGDSPPLVGVAVVAESGDRRDADGVVVASRQQRCPGGRTQRRHVEVAVAQSVVGERVHVGRMDRRAVAAEVAETGVVQEDHDNVGGVAPRRGRRPVRFRILVGDSYPAAESFR